MKNGEKRLKMAIISGAAHALQYKEKNPRATEQEVIQYVSAEIENILDKLDAENWPLRSPSKIF